MTNGEKHIEKLLSWYKEAVTEDGVCYLTCDDKNTLAYALKCCKHFEDIKKDIDTWMFREEPSSSGKPNKPIEEKCPCYHCEYFEIKGWSHCKIHEDAYGDSRCNDYHKVSQDLTKVNQGSNRSEIPTGSVDCISRADALALFCDKCSVYNCISKCSSYRAVKKMPSVTPQEPRCKECKWWKDSDGAFRRGIGAESQCPINTQAVYCGEGYCYKFSPKADREVEE